MKNQEAIELLEKAQANYNDGYETGNPYFLNPMAVEGFIDKALALLRAKPACATCGDSKVVAKYHGDTKNNIKKVTHIERFPCPDCPKPETELAKELRKIIEYDTELATGSTEIINQAADQLDADAKEIQAWREKYNEIYDEHKQQAKRIAELEKEKWYINPQEDTLTSPYKGKGLTWIEYAQRKFKRAEGLQFSLEKADEKIELLEGDNARKEAAIITLKDIRDVLQARLEAEQKRNDNVALAYDEINTKLCRLKDKLEALKCPKCGGDGKEPEFRASGSGWASKRTATCKTCKGTGINREAKWKENQNGRTT